MADGAGVGRPGRAAVAPPGHVLAAFSAAGLLAVPLGGGLQTAWRAGDLVLKRADLDEDELAWQARVLPRIACDGFRLARWVAAADGSLCVDGWCASEYLAGRHEDGRWAEIVAVGDRFHAALRGTRRPPFLNVRSGPWADADRVAWGERRPGDLQDVRHLDALVAARRPLSAPSQLVHGDLTGNVLFHDQLPPAIIDLSPYWRPVAYASAIVIADALVWEGADARVLGAVDHISDFGQYLVRALIFRLVADRLLGAAAPPGDEAGGERWEPAVALALALATQLTASYSPASRSRSVCV